MRSLAGSCLVSMQASISGWLHRSVPKIAPRRDPALMVVWHIASRTFMKLKGSGASDPTLHTGAPHGCNVKNHNRFRRLSVG